MAESITDKAIKNSAVTMLCQLVFLIVSFICRTIFSKLLGTEYLGVGGLFSNILTILSFAELGIGSALVYRMYAPLAKGDQEKVKQYLLVYRCVYRLIILIVAAVGLAIIPLIPYLVKAPAVKESITLLYVLYLCQTLVSYVCVYKKSLLIADQKNYIVNIYNQIFNIAMNATQCVFLVFTHSFVIYCLLNIAFNLADNIACSLRANREYPYIRKPPEGKLSKFEVKGLFRDVKGLLLTKIASTAFSGTDNIFISAYIGIRHVGILSNYFMFANIINGIMNRIFYSITASIGNLVAVGEKRKTEEVINKLFFINTSLYGYLFLGMFFLLRPFVMTLWLNSEYNLPQFVIALMLLELFLRSIHYPLYTVRTAMGSFSEHKVLFALAAALNIVLDFLMVKPLGIAGLFISTILCRGITYLVDIWVVYHIQLHVSMTHYLLTIFKWLLFLAACGWICSVVISWICLENWPGFITKGLAITALYCVTYLLIFGRSDEFSYFVNLLKNMLKRVKK